MSSLFPASDLPGLQTSSSLPLVDEEKTKGRTWNGYVCPGCRTVFRVAADFIGVDVMCPSCNETLRLPHTPEEVTPYTSPPEKPSEPAASLPTPVRHSKISTTDGRLKLSLAVLVPMTLAAAALLLFPLKEFTPKPAVPENKAPVLTETSAPEKPAPLPPPIAVSEMPVPPPPAVPQPEEIPMPEVAVVQPVPEQPVLPAAEPVAEQVVDTIEPAPPIATPNDGLVEAIPVTSEPTLEQPAPAPLLKPEATTTPAELVHTVVRGDTLHKISRKYQVGIAIIKNANGMKGDAVMLGHQLKIPGAVTPTEEPAPPTIAETPAQAPQADRFHTVVRGDTLERIARKYGVTSQQIMQSNNMKSDVVRLGRKLVIPARP